MLRSPNFYRAIQHPFFPVILAVGTMIGGYSLGYSSVAPVYKGFPSSVVAKRESPRLSVSWDGTPIESLCIGRVAFWNEGNAPIRMSDLPTSDPLRIVASKPVRILSIEPTNASRNSLRIDPIISTDASGIAYLKVLEGEAMEEDDGVAYKILFTGSCADVVFSVSGRVIGAGRGVRALPPDADVRVYYKRLSRLLVIAVICIALVISSMREVEKPAISKLHKYCALLGIAVCAGVMAWYGVQFALAIPGELPPWMSRQLM